MLSSSTLDHQPTSQPRRIAWRKPSGVLRAAALLAVAILLGALVTGALHGEGAGASSASAFSSGSTPSDKPGDAEARARPFEPARLAEPGARIVNGLATVLFPSTVALITPGGSTFCTGTLIGCSTVLTASHCVCESVGANCQTGGADLTPPGDIFVFAQHGGVFPVASVHVPANYTFAVDADVAILKLGGAPVSGITPSPINTFFRLGTGSVGRLAGFGLTRGDLADTGVKRWGDVLTSPCTTVPNTEHLCWRFENPIGPPATDSNTCPGDSGGPLFANFGDGRLTVAGVTSGGNSNSCLPLDNSFDADVFVERTYIQAQAGADLNSGYCGLIGQAGTPFAPIFFGSGTLSAGAPFANWVQMVPAGTQRLRVTLNAEDGMGNDFDFYLNFGSVASPSDFDCRSVRTGNYEICDIANPTSGNWYAHVLRFAGSGFYQLTLTPFGRAGIFADGFESGDLSAWSLTVP